MAYEKASKHVNLSLRIVLFILTRFMVRPSLSCYRCAAANSRIARDDDIAWNDLRNKSSSIALIRCSAFDE